MKYSVTSAVPYSTYGHLYVKKGDFQRIREEDIGILELVPLNDNE